MRIYTEIVDNIVVCTCHRRYIWEPQDLKYDEKYPTLYYLECPACHERHWIVRNPELDEMYNNNKEQQ